MGVPERLLHGVKNVAPLLQFGILYNTQRNFDYRIRFS